MTLRRGPSRMAAEEYGRPDKYYAYLEGSADSAIILEKAPFLFSRPMGIWTGAERRDFPIHVPTMSHPAPPIEGGNRA